MMHQRYKSQSPNDSDIEDNERNNQNYNSQLPIGENDDVQVNETKLGALLFFPLIGIMVTSCLGDMWHRNSTMHREPNTARALLVNCPAKDPDNVWLLMVCCYLIVVSSIVVLTRTMLGLGTMGSTKMRVFRCRICLFLFYWSFYNWDICMGTMPYLKKASTQVYFAAIIFFICSPTLSMPLVIPRSRSSSSKPSRWPLFMIKLMVFILYADAAWHKLQNGFSNNTLRAFLVHHWIYYERSMALFLLDHSWLTAISAHATLFFEGFGWLLMCLGYDVFAALVMLSFHIGIYLAMDIDFITFWCCSFVFSFVPSISSSNKFQQLLKRRGGKKSKSVPLGCSHFLEMAVENENEVMNESSNSRSERKRKASIILPVFCVVAFTYKGFYPLTFMLPGVPHSRNSSFLSRLYEQLSGMTFKPFNTFNMYTRASFPMDCSAANLVLKQRTTNGKKQRVKFIPHKGSDFYLYSNMLDRLHPNNKDDKFTLNLSKDITRCNIFACLAREFILSDSVGTLWETQVDSVADIESIELVEEIWFDKPTGAANGVDSNNNEIGHGFVQIVGANSLERQIKTMCALDIGNHSHEPTQDLPPFASYEDDSCGKILAELDKKAMSFDASSGKNPFYVMPVRSRTEKHMYRSADDAREIPIW
eukprot:CAMPEP_0197186196 /NCGR_PEP_ID=MMETSP1423-20130617/13389_1 /TAXON_ID=476441 /ORGANISM="Pseudo-nitzschia heimii, Strain UNC1101" /LENGTH=646 /DNA_ID=CAMNT_0042637429 /DNA_START=140 /DNA_END=2077 /DNA_ORIENTATION=+